MYDLMKKKLIELGTAVVALLILAFFCIIGATLVGSDLSTYLYLFGVIAFTVVLIILGRKVSEPVI